MGGGLCDGVVEFFYGIYVDVGAVVEDEVE